MTAKEQATLRGCCPPELRSLAESLIGQGMSYKDAHKKIRKIHLDLHPELALGSGTDEEKQRIFVDSLHGIGKY